MHFGMTEEQAMIVETTRAFVENELYPHELEIERSGHLDMDLVKEIQTKAIEAGLYAANMPEEVGGAGLDTLTWAARTMRFTGLVWRGLRISCWQALKNRKKNTFFPVFVGRNGTVWR